MSRNVEIYDNEEQVIKRINDLKDQGVLEKDMYIVINSNEELSIMQSVHNVHVDQVDKYSEIDKKENKGFFGRFMDTIRREDRVKDAFYRMDLRDSERDKYLEKVRDGKILLYVDQNYVHDYEDIASGRCYGGVCNVYGAEGSERISDVLYKKDERDMKLGKEDERIDHTVRAKEGRRVERTVKDDVVPPAPVNEPVRERAETEGERTVELREERLKIDKEEAKAGEVRVSKHVDEVETSVDVPVKEEEVYVERRTVDRPVSEADDLTDEARARRADGEVVIPIVEEKVTVTKEPVVVEEIVIGKKTKEHVEHVEETIKKEKLDIDSEGHVAVDSDLDVDKTKK